MLRCDALLYDPGPRFNITAFPLYRTSIVVHLKRKKTIKRKASKDQTCNYNNLFLLNTVLLPCTSTHKEATTR